MTLPVKSNFFKNKHNSISNQNYLQTSYILYITDE